MRYKLRFHLARGEYFKHWQIRDNKGNINYYDPNLVEITLYNCKLKNRLNIAEEIFNGEAKRVCSWVEFDDYEISETINYEPMIENELKYNPRLKPYWQNHKGDILDGFNFDTIITNKNKIYVR